MKIKQITPSHQLRPFIKSFTFVESEHGTENFILPDTSLVWALRYQGNVSVTEHDKRLDLPTSVISGMRKSSRLITYARSTASLLVIFEPGGASPFFEEPLHELFGQSLPMGYLKGYAPLNNLPERLSVIKNQHQQVLFVERVLLSLLKKPTMDKMVFLAVQKIKSANGTMLIKKLTDELYISQDAFEKRFRQSVGSTPKQFSSVIRLRNTIDNHAPEQSLTETALAAGYYDQAHFIREFKVFTGQSPTRFFNNVTFW